MKKPIRGQNWTESTIFTSLNQLSSWPQKFTGDVYATTESVKCLVQTAGDLEFTLACGLWEFKLDEFLLLLAFTESLAGFEF